MHVIILNVENKREKSINGANFLFFFDKNK